MPQNKYAIARYRLIDAILRKIDYVKTSFLANVCEDRLGYSVSQRTIQLDLKAMKYDPFLGYFAPIEYCNRNKAYYYSHTDFTIPTINYSEEEIRVLLYLSRYLPGKIDSDYYHIFRDYLKKLQKQHLF